jgi:hypothetical protein
MSKEQRTCLDVERLARPKFNLISGPAAGLIRQMHGCTTNFSLSIARHEVSTTHESAG